MFAEYAPLVFKAASNYLHDPEDCRECVNDTFLEIYKHPERYDPKKGSHAVYLSAIARKKAISKWRKNRRSDQTSASAIEDPAMPENAKMTGDLSEQISARIDLEQALSTLDEEELRLIRLKYYNGMSIREIADEMQIPYEAVKKRHQRILKKLRLLMLIIVILAVLAGCAHYFTRKMGIVPGYGTVAEDAPPVYLLEEPVRVPISQTDLEVLITMAFYQGDTLSVNYRITDKEGRMLSERELGYFCEIRKRNNEDYVYCISPSMESWLYIGSESYEEIDSETMQIGNSGPECFDKWLKEDLAYWPFEQKGEEIFQCRGAVWRNQVLPSVLKGEEEVTVTIASDFVLKEEESIRKHEYDVQSNLLSEQRRRFEATLTLQAASFEKLSDYACDYNEEDGGILAIPRLQDGRLIVAIYPLAGSHGRIVKNLVSTSTYEGTRDDPQIGILTVTAEDGTVLKGTLLGRDQSDARLYSEWDFGPADPGTYRLHIPYLLKYYESQEGQKCASIPFSLKQGTVRKCFVSLKGIRISVSQLQPIEWEELLLGSSRQAADFYEIKETMQYCDDDDLLWRFKVETKVPYPDETVVSLCVRATQRNAYIFPISDSLTGVFAYNLPQDGILEYCLYWDDAENRLYTYPLDTWTFDFYLSGVDSLYGEFGSTITTRWEHPVELEFAVE